MLTSSIPLAAPAPMLAGILKPDRGRGVAAGAGLRVRLFVAGGRAVRLGAFGFAAGFRLAFAMIPHLSAGPPAGLRGR